jgi:hypothetical protein
MDDQRRDAATALESKVGRPRGQTVPLRGSVKGAGETFPLQKRKNKDAGLKAAVTCPWAEAAELI